MSKKFPIEFSHLEKYKSFCKHIKGDTYGFYIPQFEKGSYKLNPMWMEFRKNTLGSSDIGIVLGLNEYGVLGKVFDEKIGRSTSSFKTPFTAFGHLMEEPIAKIMWQGFDGIENSWLDNMYNGVIVRKLQSENCFAMNTKYPWLSVSIDYKASKNQVSPFTGEVVPYTFPVECKTISEFAEKKFATALPPQYIAQIQAQMLVYGVEYAEFAVFVDKQREFKCYPATPQQDLVDVIIEKTRAFWDIIEKARAEYEVASQGGENAVSAARRLQSLEPDAESGQYWQEYLNEKYKDPIPDSIMQGDYDSFVNREDYLKYSTQIKELEAKQSLCKNRLLYEMKDYEVMVFDEIGEEGKITNYRKSETRSRAYFSVK